MHVDGGKGFRVGEPKATRKEERVLVGRIPPHWREGNSFLGGEIL